MYFMWKVVPSFEELDGGHYIPTTVSSTRFDERNINAQCHRCNRFLHANLRGYFRGLEAKLGRSGLDDLEALAAPTKWTRQELNAIRDYYKSSNSTTSDPELLPSTNGPVDMQSMFAIYLPRQCVVTS
jgi:hypothetical protein